MSAKAQVYLWSLLLILVGAGIISYKSIQLDIPLTHGEKRDVWVVEALVEFETQDKPVKVKVALPTYYAQYKLLEQQGSSNGYGFTTEESPNKKAVWSSRQPPAGNQKIYYTFSIFETDEFQSTKGKDRYKFDKPYFEPAYKTAALSLVDSAWKKSSDNSTFAKEVIRRLNFADPDQNTNLVRSLIKGTYTEAHLVRDLILLKDVPATVLRGLQLEDGTRKTTTGNYLAFYDEKWSVINHISGEIGLPKDTIFWALTSVLETAGCTNSKITFSMIKSDQSAKSLAIKNSLEDSSPIMNFSIFSLPLEFQSVFKLLLLIPVGTLIVVIIRNLVGISTSGTFMPVLLAIAFIETSLVKGLVVLLVMMVLGLLIRTYLSRMNLLLVPRISAVVICVVILMAFISITSYKMGIAGGISVTFFPMIIISWTIERTSIMWEEHGGREVFEKMGGSLIVSIIIYFVMTNSFVKYFTFTFPEVMLIMLAFVLLIGVYTGYRLTEIFRFEPLVTDEDIKQ
ncbi:inactive transglutaminase family protein [Lentisphaera profundi]|uniref:Inactive transglutaminase family protein n=1 Tax=Lentisphaera profundi TaxID=1658616 RepID=A0ABY7VSS7_9BACT|nr:inactive transglutaminase family protein [Lentisphaera profundi]WDE95829.1 inactive transglutaminase family protein [Lentisphaera profundi]